MAKGRSNRRRRRLSELFPQGVELRLTIAISVVYLTAWIGYMSQHPTGAYPSESEQVLLSQALAISKGEASVDGHSYNVYTLLLSACAKFLPNESSLSLFAKLLNAIALTLTALICASASGRYWRDRRSVWITGLLVGLNPILIFWSTTVGPSILSALLIAIGFTRALFWPKNSSLNGSFWIGLTLGCAAFFNTAGLFLALFWPIAAWLHSHRSRMNNFAVATVGPIMAITIITFSPVASATPIQIALTDFDKNLYGFVNSYEAFDDKSFSLYKQIHLLIFLSPIHWGALLLFAITAFYSRVKWGFERRSVYFTSFALLSLGIGHTLLAGGSQMRLALHPLLAICAGGLVLTPAVWKKALPKEKVRVIAAILLICGILYSNFFQIRSKDTWAQDYAYLALANLAANQNSDAEIWATKALELDSSKASMQNVLTFASFNSWALSPTPKPLPIETCQEYLMTAELGDSIDPEVDAIKALYSYKLRNTDSAIKTWAKIQKHSSLASLFLFWSGHSDELDTAPHTNSPYYEILIAAKEINRNSLKYTKAQQMMDNILAVGF